MHTGIEAPDVLVDWPLGSAGVASFVAAVPAGERRTLHAEAVEVLGPGQPLVLELLVLSNCAVAARCDKWSAPGSARTMSTDELCKIGSLSEAGEQGCVPPGMHQHRPEARR